MRLFHYTIGSWLIKIVEDKQIKLATAFLPIGVKPAVWFTTKPSWEQTCNKNLLLDDGTMKSLNEKETEQKGGGLFRIEANPVVAPYTWKDYKRLSGADPKLLARLEKTARLWGARPELEWRVNFEPVGLEYWLRIEKWTGKRWEICSDLIQAGKGVAYQEDLLRNIIRWVEEKKILKFGRLEPADKNSPLDDTEYYFCEHLCGKPSEEVAELLHSGWASEVDEGAVIFGEEPDIDTGKTKVVIACPDCLTLLNMGGWELSFRS